jgi:hypothetical protein
VSVVDVIDMSPRVRSARRLLADDQRSGQYFGAFRGHLKPVFDGE